MPEPGRSGRILIVDDNRTFANVLREGLSTKGYECAVCHSYGSALEQLASEPFDVVVTDLHIGEMTGINLCEAVKERFPRVVRILMSGSLSPREAATFGHSSLSGYLRKPFALEAVIEIFERERAKLGALLPE